VTTGRHLLPENNLYLADACMNLYKSNELDSIFTAH